MEDFSESRVHCLVTLFLNLNYILHVLNFCASLITIFLYGLMSVSIDINVNNLISFIDEIHSDLLLLFQTLYQRDKMCMYHYCLISYR